MGVLHEEVEGIIQGEVVGHVLLLELGLNGQEGHAHVGGTANGAALLKGDNGTTAGGVQRFLGLSGSGQTGHATGNDDDICFHLSHNFFLLNFSDVDMTVISALIRSGAETN